MSVRIAVLDDDVRILDAIALVLEAQDWIVRTYSSGQAFLDELRGDWYPQCLVLDPHLHGISGPDIVEAVRSVSDIPIIGLTARPSSPLTTRVVEAGVHTVLTKPVSAEKLIDQIQAVIESAPRRDSP